MKCCFQILDMPQAKFLQKSIIDLNIGTYLGVEVKLLDIFFSLTHSSFTLYIISY